MIENQENTTLNECLNCHQQLPEEATFCPNCGQKNTTGLISLKEFLHNFIDNVFNLDSRIVQTLKWLCIPAKLTQEYFKGKHRTYYHPIRLYLVMSILFFALLSFQKDGEIFELNIGGDDFFEKGVKEKYKLNFLAKMDTLSQKITEINPHPKAKEALDSLKQLLPKPMEKDSFWFVLMMEDSTKIDQLDALTLDGKELVEKYNIKGFWNQIFVKQAAHFFHDRNAFSRQIANNFPLMLLAMIPLLALILKLLYIRQKRYYVEHLVLNFHHHAFMFFLLSLVFLLPEKWVEKVIPFAIIAVLVFLFFTMKKYYQQGYGKTFLKFVLFNIFYLLSFFIVLAITFIISFLLF